MTTKVFKRATALLELDRGKTLQALAQTLAVSYPTVLSRRNKYHEHGLGGLYEAAGTGRPIVINSQQWAKITALACTQAPAGVPGWSLRLLAGKVVELGYCTSLSHTQDGHILKITN